MELMYYLVLGVILVIVTTNLFNKEQSGNWKVRTLLSALWFGLAALASQLKNMDSIVIIGIIIGFINAVIAYALWDEREEGKK